MRNILPVGTEPIDIRHEFRQSVNTCIACYYVFRIPYLMKHTVNNRIECIFHFYSNTSATNGAGVFYIRVFDFPGKTLRLVCISRKGVIQLRMCSRKYFLIDDKFISCSRKTLIFSPNFKDPKEITENYLVSTQRSKAQFNKSFSHRNPAT